MADVWDENWYGSTKTLDVTIGRLRQKLEGVGVSERVVAVRGVGFRLEGGPPMRNRLTLAFVVLTILALLLGAGRRPHRTSCATWSAEQASVAPAPGVGC